MTEAEALVPDSRLNLNASASYRVLCNARRAGEECYPVRNCNPQLALFLFAPDDQDGTVQDRATHGDG